MALDKSNLSPAGTDYSESQKTSAFLDLNMFNQATYYYINGAIDKFPVDELELMRAYIETMSDDTDLKTQLINILSRIDHLLELYKTKQSFENEGVPTMNVIESRESAQIIYNNIVYKYNYKRPITDLDELCDQFSKMNIESEKILPSIKGNSCSFFKPGDVYMPQNCTDRYPNLKTAVNLG